jgi:hypothetical protein
MHTNVERLIGRLVTDPESLRRFALQPTGTLIAQGLELTPVELAALAALDPAALRALAAALDPRLRRAPRATDESAADGAEDPTNRGLAAEETRQ